jgi:hypothetical protein
VEVSASSEESSECEAGTAPITATNTATGGPDDEALHGQVKNAT